MGSSPSIEVLVFFLSSFGAFMLQLHDLSQLFLSILSLIAHKADHHSLPPRPAAFTERGFVFCSRVEADAGRTKATGLFVSPGRRWERRAWRPSALPRLMCSDSVVVDPLCRTKGTEETWSVTRGELSDIHSSASEGNLLYVFVCFAQPFFFPLFSGFNIHVVVLLFLSAYLC